MVSILVFSLADQAKIDAVVDMPDKKWNEFEKCVIEVDGFQGESVFNKILGKIPESGLGNKKRRHRRAGCLLFV